MAELPIHPGHHVRDTILVAKKMTVTAAASVVGVGRPALSRFLNGRAATTPDMAARIERAFGISAHALLEMQAAHDAAQSRAKGVPANAKPYVPPFLGITANELEVWATKIAARSRLAVLLRILVNSTGLGLTKVDFPGNDDAERPGWDGFIEASQATQWLPDGISGWEFGTNSKIDRKADGDFAKSLNATAEADRRNMTFVFVTPRRWSGKKAWVDENRAKGLWKDVRAYDSSDLEQWLEQSLAGQAWFANETQHPSQGVRSLDRCWSDWANTASPPLPGSLFAPAIRSGREVIAARLKASPSEPTIIAADSALEAIAFLAQLFGEAGGDELAKYRDQVLVFEQPGTLTRLADGSRNLIAVTASREVQRELGPLARAMHSIIVCPRNTANTSPHVVLEPLADEAFRTALEPLGYSRDDIIRLSNASGRSLTVLRRRLSNVPAVKTPAWAADATTASAMVPFLLAGAWNTKNAADQAVLVLLAKTTDYESLEKECQRLCGLDDAPTWSIGSYRGVVSKIDLLFAVAAALTVQDLERYFEIAKMVLSEDDPRLDLPEEERWAAALHGKTREISPTLRKGIAETLVLLAVHGKHLFLERLGFDCEFEASRLVRELLTPLTTRVLEANDRDLPVYAEAAPEALLSLIEEDLKRPQPETYGLMRPAASGVLGGCARTGLLWALETAAWNPQTLPRVALILAQLAEIKIEDNWVNKPAHSLGAIFRVWMPQTAADHEERLGVLRLLIARFPRVAWDICIAQLEAGPHLGHYSHKPSWRTDAHGFGEPFPTLEPVRAFLRDVAGIVIDWTPHTCETLCDLIAHLSGLSEQHQARVWALIKSWAQGASDSEKALVREKIRVKIMSRRALKHSPTARAAFSSELVRSAYQALEPTDLLCKHQWLFRESWVEESADELSDDDFDLQEREQRIAKLRADALREVLANLGVDGVITLAETGKAAPQIGWLLAREILAESDLLSFLLRALPAAGNDDHTARKALVVGALRSIQDASGRARIIAEASKKLSETELTRLLLLAPFRRTTWQAVDALEPGSREMYWQQCVPEWIHDSDDESNEAVERLLAVKRPRAAFASVHLRLEALRPEILFRLMSEMVQEGNDKPGQYRIDRYHIEEAFALLDKSPDLTLEQKASLELAYLEALSQPWGHERYGIPNLEKYVETHPDTFVQAVVWLYKRDDGGEDPPQWRVEPERAQHLAQVGYKLLHALHEIPGRDHLGQLQPDLLCKWVDSVRVACRELGRLDSADGALGQLLSRAPSGPDGVWPCEPVRRVMEEIHSAEMMDGARIGRYNSRGAVWRRQGGEQERELAGQYRRWAEALRYAYPFVASQLLMPLARSYEREADREDTEAEIEKRLH